MEFPRNLETLPTEFGALTGLVRLDLEGTNVKELPESFTRTRCNLEIVKIGGNCRLPRDIQNWPRLKHFTHHRVSYGDMMPRGMEKLIYLESLESYMVRRQAAQICSRSSTNDDCISHRSGIEELAALNFLQVLHIRSLENVRPGGLEDAERAKLRDKSNLRELYLHWGSIYGDDDDWSIEGDFLGDEDGEDYEDAEKLYLGWRDHKNDDMVLEGLRPHLTSI